MVETHPDVKIKGKTSAYTSMNGHMFSFLGKRGEVALRLSKADQAAFVETYGTPPVIQYGSTMRGYVELPDVLRDDLDALKAYFAMSIAYIETLKPKPTKKSKK